MMALKISIFLFLVASLCNLGTAQTVHVDSAYRDSADPSLIWERPLTILDHVLLQVRSRLVGEADILQSSWRAGRDRDLWSTGLMGPSIDPLAYVEPGSGSITTGLYITVDSLRQPARQVCTFIIMAGVESSVAAGTLERENKTVRDNVMSFLVPPTFYASTTPLQRRVAYDSLQTRINLSVSLLEVKRHRYTHCERNALSDSLHITQQEVGR